MTKKNNFTENIIVQVCYQLKLYDDLLCVGHNIQRCLQPRCRVNVFDQLKLSKFCFCRSLNIYCSKNEEKKENFGCKIHFIVGLLQSFLNNHSRKKLVIGLFGTGLQVSGSQPFGNCVASSQYLLIKFDILRTPYNFSCILRCARTPRLRITALGHLYHCVTLDSRSFKDI